LGKPTNACIDDPGKPAVGAAGDAVGFVEKGGSFEALGCKDGGALVKPPMARAGLGSMLREPG
jgi:hypothetical protein